MLLVMDRACTLPPRSIQPRTDRISSSGLADPSILALINLVGLPPMSAEEFARWQPETTVGLLLALTLPWGEYNRLNEINLGSNRYALRLGLPIHRPFAGLWGRPATLEFVPSMNFFTKNDANGVKQDPLLTLEGQLSHDFTGKLWGGTGNALYLRRQNPVERNYPERFAGVTRTLRYAGLRPVASLGAEFPLRSERVPERHRARRNALPPEVDNAFLKRPGAPKSGSEQAAGTIPLQARTMATT
ncbi:MAG: transporter [Xanthomonadales bacterium]|nr:transporter [Xanthomonadales bacterium]